MPASSGQPHIQAVVFDLDDTLYAERDYVRSGYRAVGRHLRERLARPDDFAAWLWQRFCRGQSQGAFDALSAEFGLGLGPSQVRQLVAVYREHEPDIQPMPGAEGLLRRLRARCRLALLSDGFLPAQQLKLEALGLEPLFDVVLFTEKLGRDHWKPSPAGYQAVRSQLDVPHAACAYVGDNPAKDFLAPGRLGWRTVRLKCDGQVHAHEPAPPGGLAYITITRLDDLEPALFP